MEITFYFIILVALLSSYFYAKRSNVKSDFVQCVEAGPIDGVDSAELKRRSFRDRQIVLRAPDGNELSHDRYVRLLVKGSCMSPRNINDGDVVIAEKVDDERRRSIRNELRVNNIVWLHIEDTGMDKIRILRGWDNDEMITYYYRNGEEHESSSHHGISQIRGIVRYKM